MRNFLNVRRRALSVANLAVVTLVVGLGYGCEAARKAWQKEFRPPPGSIEEKLCGTWKATVRHENDPAVSSTTFVLTLRYGRPTSEPDAVPYVNGFCTVDQQLTELGKKIASKDPSGASTAASGMPVTKVHISGEEITGEGEYATGRKITWKFVIDKSEPDVLYVTTDDVTANGLLKGRKFSEREALQYSSSTTYYSGK
jgi:hypothetical protein